MGMTFTEQELQLLQRALLRYEQHAMTTRAVRPAVKRLRERIKNNSWSSVMEAA